MRVIYLSQYFPPEVGATQTRAYEMGQGLVKAGHQVTMIAEFPNHPKGIIPAEYRGKLYERATLDGIEVIRVWVKASPNKSFHNRISFYLSYMILAILAGLFLARGRYDAIYATSPPLFVGGAGLVISILRRIPTFFEVRDLWPESAVALGELKNRWAIRMSEWLEMACYRRSRKIIVVTEGMSKRLIERGIPANKITLIPNGANTTLFRPSPEEGIARRKELGLEDNFVVLYAGIHGIAQGLQIVLQVADLLRNNPKLIFVFLGEGPEKGELCQLARVLNLTNVRFLPEVPRDQMPGYFSMADISLSPLRRIDLFKGALPSKLFDSWACGCPTISTIPGEAMVVLEKSGAGIYVEPEDPFALAKMIEVLSENLESCRHMGARGREFVTAHYSREKQATQLVELLSQNLSGISHSRIARQNWMG